MSTPTVGKRDITVALVEGLIADQFPQWAHLAVTPVELDGWDNTTFRLGDTMSVRLPSDDGYVPQVDKEQRWLPVLAPQLPVAIPTPLGRGEPSPAFPRPWSVYGWIDGTIGATAALADMTQFAADVAGFLGALYECDPAGPAPGAHSFSRGGPVTVWDAQTRAAIEALEGVVDTAGALAVWDAAIAARHDGPDVWVHGDITSANLVVRDGRLAGVIDFGCSAVGDPACDLTITWTFFDGESRRRFMSLVPVSTSAWARGRGWALWKALLHLQGDLARPGRARYFDDRVGWRRGSREVVTEVVEDLRLRGE